MNPVASGRMLTPPFATYQEHGPGSGETGASALSGVAGA